MDNFSVRLKELRTERGLTQSQLANETGFTQAAINFWENGKRSPNCQVIVALANYFKVSCDYLLGVE